MRRTLWLLVAVGIPVLLSAVAVGVGAEGRVGHRASPVLGPELRISGPNAASNDYFPAVAWNEADDEYLVVWQDGRNLNSRGWDIYGRRVGADGAGPELRISGAGAVTEDGHPAVVWNQTAEEYLVVWMDYRNSSTRAADIYGRRVGADGVPIGGDIRISGPQATGEDWFPAVAWNQTANEYLVVWEDLRSDSTRGHDIYGRRVGADGARLGADLRISGPKATGNENYPAVAWNQDANQYLVVWQDDRNSSTRHYDTYGRRVGADGARLGGDIRISGPQAIGEEWEPAVACNQTAGEYLVVWGDFRDDLTGGSDIYGRRVGADGARLGGDLRISGANNASWEEKPAVAWNQVDNEYLVVWQDWRNVSTSGANTYGRRVGDGGAGMGGDFLISGPNTTNDYNPAAAWNQADNEYLVVWQDERNLATQAADVYGRRVTP
jgi:hypothetical protein